MLAATQALTVVAEIAPERRALLDQRLAAIAASLHGNLVFRPEQLPDTHFMRFVIIDDPRGELPALLAWESNHDGRIDDYLAAVARGEARKIEAVFECCTGYRRALIADVEAWVSWIKQRALPAGAFYTGYRGMPRARVLNDRRVHDAIREAVELEDRAALAGVCRAEIQRRLHARVAERYPELDLSPTRDLEPQWRFAVLIAIIVGLLVLIVGLPLVVAGVRGLAIVVAGVLGVGFAGYLMLRRRESLDLATAYARPADVDPAVRAAEDQVTQNQLTHIVDIKPGAFRIAVLWIVLKGVDLLARYYFVHGALGGITAIHFARWVILFDKRPVRRKRHRLLFFSNYDGSWESYLGEFIDRAAAGLTAVWSNTRGFPATEHLLLAGARDEEAFKQWTREHQIFTQVWWSGVPDSTVRNVLDDLWIRNCLGRGLSDHELVAWLRRL